MDTIIIKNLKFYAYHGVYEQEARQGQEFVLNAKLYADLDQAGQSDALEDTIHYGMVCEFLVEFLTQHTYKLLEKAITEACHAVLLEFDGIQKIEMTLEKPNAPIVLEFESVGVTRRIGWHKVSIGLGSNMGDKKAYIEGAIRKLSAHPLCRDLKVSSLIETKPYGGVVQEDFLNGAAVMETLLSPKELLSLLQQMETEADRKRQIHWGPRTLDLDILFYDDLVMSGETLCIPHPDMKNRSFVLEPLSELLPDYRHPVTKKTIRQMKEELKKR